MFIPYNTDAPIYHLPIGTVGLIVANVAVYLIVAVGGNLSPESWVLVFADGVHPEQWLLSIFMHAGWMHLIGNMIFLWVFGLVVEGKLGWWRFIPCYLAIGMGQMGIEQFAMLHYTGEQIGAVGASGAIFGLMAMAMIWAPLNEIGVAYLVGFSYGTVDVDIAVLAGLYTGWEVVMICIFGGDAGSSWLHLTGFALGLPMAVAMLKTGVVDCEGWDAFTVWSGNYGGFKKEPDYTEVDAKINAEKQSKEEQLLQQAKQQFRVFLQQQNIDAAIRLYEKMKHVRGGFTPECNEWMPMIQWLHGQKRWAESAPFMAKYIDAYPAQADAVRIKLAQICVLELMRPGKALELLTPIKTASLPEKQKGFVERIRVKAIEMQHEGVVELDTDTW